MPSPTTIPDEEARRRQLCDHLGRAALADAPRVLHSKCGLHLACAPGKAPELPYGSLWTLVNHLKVLRQYTDLISAAASGQGPHALPLSSSQEACAGGLEWLAPLLGAIPSTPDLACQARVDAWRQANPGLYSHAEAAFHVHQEMGIDCSRDMTRHLVRCLNPSAKEYEVDIAGNVLRPRPSFDEFADAFGRWRENALYHLMCLAARNMPMASHWMPRALLHEADDWQDLLTQFNTSSFCSPARMEGTCLALWDRSSLLNNNICSMLDRLAILARVCSREPSLGLDDCLARLRFPSHDLRAQDRIWYGLRRAMEGVPPSLLCPALYPPNRSAWGYRSLRLLMRGGRPYIHTGDLAWIDKAELGECKEASSGLPDRLHDILLRVGEAATAPEVAHLMLHPESLSDALAGRRVIREGLPNLSDRAFVMGEMDRPDRADAAHPAFSECVDRLLNALPVSTCLDLPRPVQLLAWRVDCPPRVILYHGLSTGLDLSAMPPHRLHKSIRQDKLQNRTVSGISLLSEPAKDHAEVHRALKACIVEEVVGPHRSFSSHPHHQALVRQVGLGGRFAPCESSYHTTTTLAEAVSVFTGARPPNLSEVPLHGSLPWTEGHVDGRYAERQVADNGSRFRDWVAVYYDPQDPQPVQRCRLASHEVKADRVYQTHLPLIGQDCSSWVSVTSTLPMDTVMLRRQQARSDLEALRRSVDTRFMHDGKLLPVRHLGDRVDREHMEIYSDRAAGQVLIAYAPQSKDGARRGIEFMSFMHAE